MTVKSLIMRDFLVAEILLYTKLADVSRRTTHYAGIKANKTFREVTCRS